jgi:hypothetical protein
MPYAPQQSGKNYLAGILTPKAKGTPPQPVVADLDWIHNEKISRSAAIGCIAFVYARHGRELMG